MKQNAKQLLAATLATGTLLTTTMPAFAEQESSQMSATTENQFFEDHVTEHKNDIDIHSSRYVGLPEQEVAVAIHAAGLQSSVVYEETSDYPAGTVIYIDEGSFAVGATVHMIIALAPKLVAPAVTEPVVPEHQVTPPFEEKFDEDAQHETINTENISPSSTTPNVGVNNSTNPSTSNNEQFDEVPIHFWDVKLQAILNTVLGKAAEADIFPSEMETIHSLDISNQRIDSISPLRYLKPGTIVNTDGNHITDFRELSGLNFSALNQTYPPVDVINYLYSNAIEVRVSPIPVDINDTEMTAWGENARYDSAQRLMTFNREGQTDPNVVVNYRSSDSRISASATYKTKEVPKYDAPMFISTDTPIGKTGKTYEYNPQVYPNAGVVTFELVGGSLPPGLTFDPYTAAISGIPTQAGSYTYKVKSTNPIGSIFIDCTIQVQDPAAPKFGPQQLPQMRAGTNFTYQLQGENVASYALANGTKLPEGLSLGSNGKISGNPAVADSFTFAIEAIPPEGEKMTQDFTVTVGSVAPAPSTSPTPSPTPILNPVIPDGDKTGSPFTSGVNAENVSTDGKNLSAGQNDSGSLAHTGASDIAKYVLATAFGTSALGVTSILVSRRRKV